MTLIASLLLGLAVGLVHFWSLARNTALYAEAKIAAAFTIQLVRLALIGGFFFGMAQFGALSLLCAFGGFLIARPVALALLKPRS